MTRLTTLDYILIAVGLLMLPIFIGLVVLGVAIWRIGSRMEKEEDQANADASKPSNNESSEPTTIDRELNSMHEEEMLDFEPQYLDKRYKLKQYSEDTLEDGK